MARTIRGWITVKGQHIPLLEGESNRQAIKKFLDRKREKTNNVNNKKGAINNIENISGYKIENYIGNYDEVTGYSVRLKTKDGFMTVGIRETTKEVYLNNIVTVSSTGQRLAEKGAGTKVLNNLKEYSDKTGKSLIVAGIVKSAEPFYDKFTWLKKEPIKIYDDNGELFDDSDVNRIYRPERRKK